MPCCAVIGKGGEQIASIQSESECKIQFAPGMLVYCTCRGCLSLSVTERIIVLDVVSVSSLSLDEM